ncbi:MAG: 50S ribosomal protein L7ae [Candidatus Diapherotrites archaeon]|nr:50S ribosomal protein L7ae [Candidatus Diapherotrites archaeon]
MAQFVKFSVPKELAEKQLLIIEKVKKTGKLRIGSNEVTKAIERGTAKLVFIAEDVTPPEIVMHLPILCTEKNIPFSYVSTKKELGEKLGLKASASSAAVVNEGASKKEIEDLAKKISELKK